MILLLGFAFLAGVATIFAPCILPILPVVLSAGVTGGKRRPLGVIIGLVLSFSFFTLTLSYLSSSFGLDPGILRIIAVIILAGFGLVLLIPALLVRFEELTARLIPARSPGKTGDGFWSGFLIGISLGLVWTPCAGPILAGVITLAATSSVNGAAVLITLAYAIGAGIPLLLVAYGGQKIVSKMKALRSSTGRLQMVFGVIMLLTALAIYTGFDRTLQTRLVEALPLNIQNGLTSSLEENDQVKQELDKLKNNPSSLNFSGDTSNIAKGETKSLPKLGVAPEFTGITQWLNSDPLTLASLKGKVVLVDFWTYTCINCIRTLPHLTNWYNQYKDEGLVIVGVHAPEFAFEKETKNVQKALIEHAINYPVAQDNNFATWKAYDNQYWPAKYLIDANGQVRYTHFGEGEYEETEQHIRFLLKEKGAIVENDTVDGLPDRTPTSRAITHETYLGTARRENLTSAASIPLDGWRKNEGWRDSGEAITVDGSSASLDLHFKAQDVFLVINTENPGLLEVLLDGQPIQSVQAGIDVKGGQVTVDQSRLYHLVHLSEVGEHLLTLKFQGQGLSAHAFTFG